MKTNAVLIALIMVVVGTIPESFSTELRIKCNGDEDCSEGEICFQHLNRCFTRRWFNPFKWFKGRCFTRFQCPDKRICNIFTGKCMKKNWCATRKTKIFCILRFCVCEEKPQKGSNTEGSAEAMEEGLAEGLKDIDSPIEL